MKPILEVNNLSYGYHKSLVLSGVQFTLQAGASVAFIGASGCGKTTLMKLIAGILPAPAGSVVCRAKQMAYVGQEDGLLAWKNVLENVLFPLHLNGQKEQPIHREKALQTLHTVGLKGVEELYPSELSGGMKKRVELARALMRDPDLLLLDEPFAALDVMMREKLNMLCVKLSHDFNMAVVLVTHGIEEACYLAQDVYLMGQSPAQLVHHAPIGSTPNTHEVFQLTPDMLAQSGQLRGVLQRYDRGEVTLSSKYALPWSWLKAGKAWTCGFGRVVLVVVLWYLMKRMFNISDFLLPYPHTVGSKFVQTMASGMIWPHLFSTMHVSLAGFGMALLIALPSGLVFNKVSWLHRLIMPLVVASNVIPVVALAPFIVLWLGFGVQAKIVTAAFIVFLPMLMSAYNAFELSHYKIINQVRFYKPVRWRAFWLLELPAAAPHIFTGVKVSLTYSVVGAVVAEFVAGSVGLGSLLTMARATYNTPLMFVSLVWLSILGLGYHACISLFERYFLRKGL